MHSRNSVSAQRRPLNFPSRMRGWSSYIDRPVKPSSQPVRPTLPYFKYSKTIWKNLQAHNPYIKSWKLAQVVAKMWRDLPEAEKKPYIDAYDAEMIEYGKALKAYQNSLGFHLQTTAKGNIEKNGEEEGSCEPNVNNDLDDEDIDCYDYSYNTKYTSYIRFMRNQQLISAIFSDEVVTSPPVDQEKYLNELKQYKENIKYSINELNSEIGALERNYECKKRNYESLDTVFKQKLKKFKS